ncbi:DUF3995 domain-containing protein [Pseudozobellia thermophila]|uniref:DUF3995 domain-containing protein n=1 Tax=Pseudozobellia thermophila TaxID=192903 RepID=UPI0014801D9B|nr:DUF3995 domain-containing protein [Pseudozobellia thermophila]
MAFVFFVLGGFHVYWLFGGVWAVERVIPTKAGGEDLPAIPRTATLIVGLVLILFAWMYLMKSGLVPVQVPKGIMNYGYWFIPSIFILRAVGDFNYVGFFKKIKHTAFAKADSKVFIPLCLAIGIMGILIQLMD